MTEQQSWKAFTVERKDHVAQVTLIGPGKGNAMGPDFWDELPGIFAELDADPEVRAVVLAGSGKHFSFGLDLPAMSGGFGAVLADKAQAGPRTDFHNLIKRMQSGINAVADCRKPVVAAIQGWCIGGGVDLISAADIRYASADAKFSIREVKVAIVADMGSFARLPAIIGDGHLRELALTGKDSTTPPARRRSDWSMTCSRTPTQYSPRPTRPPPRSRPTRRSWCRVSRTCSTTADPRGERQPALRGRVECGLPAVGGPHRGHHGGVPEASTRVPGTLTAM